MGQGLLHGLYLGGDAHVAGVQLAPPADGAADGHHGHGGHAHPVRPQKDHAQDIVGGLEAPVGPDLHPVAKPRPHQGPVGPAHPQLHGKAGVFEGVEPGRPRPPLKAGEGDDVGPRLGDAHGDGADAGDHRHLHRDQGLGVHRLQLLNELGQVLNGVEVVVVGGADEVHPGHGVAGGRHLGGDLLARQVPALPGLGPLADLDLYDAGGVQHVGVDAKAARGHLLPPPVGVLAQHVGDFPALAVHGQHVEALGRLGVGPEGRLPLGTEAHGADDEGQGVPLHGKVHLLRGHLAPFGEAHLQKLPGGHRAFPLQGADLLLEVAVGGLARGHLLGRLVDPGVEAEVLGRGHLLRPEEAFPLQEGPLQLQEAVPSVLRAQEVAGAEDLGQLRLQTQGAEDFAVAPELVDAHGGDDLLQALPEGLEGVRHPLPPLEGPGLLLQKPRSHSLGPQAQEEGHVVQVPHPAGVDQKRGLAP